MKIKLSDLLIFLVGIIIGGCIMLYLLNDRNFENIQKLEDCYSELESKDKKIINMYIENEDLKRIIRSKQDIKDFRG